MTVRFQLTIDCADPQVLTKFWANALHHDIEPPPAGFQTWNDYWRSVGVPEDEIGEVDSADSLIDPDGAGPRIWFQLVPESKSVKNRLHLDIRASNGRESPLAERRTLVDAEAARLEGLGAHTVRVLSEAGLDHYAVTMTDPEGNEFCVN